MSFFTKRIKPCASSMTTITSEDLSTKGAPGAPVAAAANIRVAEISARLDGLPATRLHLAILGCCTVAFGFDLFEMGIGNGLAAVFSAAPHRVGSGELAWLLGAIYVGAAVGAPTFGVLADRFGRRVVLSYVLLLMAVCSAAGAASQSVSQLSAARVAIGLSVGAFPPILFAFLTDLLPAKNRGRFLFLMTSVAFLGAPAGVFLMRALGMTNPFGIEGWRWALIVGCVGALGCALLFRILPESPRWLASKGRLDEAQESLLRLESSRPLTEACRRDTETSSVHKAVTPVAPYKDPVAPWLWLLFFLSPWATVAFPLLTGAVLAAKGVRLNDALLYVGLSTFGPVIGALASAFHIDSIGRRTALAIGALAMTGAGFAFVVSDAPAALVISAGGFSVFAAIFVPTLSTYGAELFPTSARASGLAITWAFNRAGAAIAPLFLLPLLHGKGPASMMMVIAGTLTAVVMLLIVLPRGREGASAA